MEAGQRRRLDPVPQVAPQAGAQPVQVAAEARDLGEGQGLGQNEPVFQDLMSIVYCGEPGIAALVTTYRHG